MPNTTPNASILYCTVSITEMKRSLCFNKKVSFPSCITIIGPPLVLGSLDVRHFLPVDS